MKSEPIIADITREVNIWEGVRQEINCFGKRLIEALLKEELLSHLGRRAYERLPLLLLKMRFLQRTKPLYIIGPESTEKTIHAILELVFKGEEKEIIEKSKALFAQISKEYEKIQLDDLVFEAYRLSHGKEIDYGYLIALRLT